jgi:hypothetical protein
MPNIGDIKKGNKRPSNDRVSRIWQSCPECGKERWVRLSHGKPKHNRCVECIHKTNGVEERGDKHWAWKGGRIKNDSGYIIVYVDRVDPYFPMSSKKEKWGGYVLEHRLVMARSLNRCLASNEIIHHKDGDKQNNTLSNLTIMTREKHKMSYGDAFREGYISGYKDANNGLTASYL